MVSNINLKLASIIRIYIMATLNTMFLGTAKLLTPKAGEAPKLDKNGMQSMIFIPIAGQCPDKRVISGTVALNEGIANNRTYLIQCTEKDADPEYGRQFNFTVVSEASMMEIVQAKQYLGEAVIIETDLDAVHEEEEDEVGLEGNA